MESDGEASVGMRREVSPRRYRLRKRYKVQRRGGGALFISILGQRYYLSDFDRNGYHLLSMSKSGYFAGFKITDIEFGSTKYVKVEAVN